MNTFIRLAFISLILWWGYLFFTTQFVIVYDAEGYEQLGRMIAHQGWAGYLRHGPAREPLFPGLVALSMLLGEGFKVSYHYPLKMIGLLFLALTMVFSYRLMRMLKIRPWLAFIGVFYLGISPMMTNTCMRLWSEFAAYPWVVLAVIWSIKSWRFLGKSGGRQSHWAVVGHGVMLAAIFFLIMSVKAVAEGVLIFYLWPFYGQIFAGLKSKDYAKAKQAARFCLIVLFVFEGMVCAYKSANYHYNGNFAFTNRGDWAFYGNTARRMQPLTLKRLGADVAAVPALGVCEKLFSPDDCEFWSARYSDDLMAQKQAELQAQGATDKAVARYPVYHAVKMVLSNPFQEALLMFIEAHKMFFWEPCVSFMAYPDWMDHVLTSRAFFCPVWFIGAFFSWAGFVFTFLYLFIGHLKKGAGNKEQDEAVLWVFNFIFWYMIMYSLFFIVDRYGYPLVSLFVALIAFGFEKTWKVF